jgi:hypothetical protein
MHARIVDEARPYRLIRGQDGRYAVVEARCGHVYSLDCEHPRHVASDSGLGMASVVGCGWQDFDHANALFRHMAGMEERYSQILR